MSGLGLCRKINHAPAFSIRYSLNDDVSVVKE